MGKIKKIGVILFVALVALLGSVLLLQYLASERVEVVELHTLDENDEQVTTRLWVVDDAGYQYLRVGAEGSGWFARLTANESFELSRQGRRASYTAVLRPDKSEQINELMQQKYTWGDSLIGMLVGNRGQSIPIELHPRQ